MKKSLKKILAFTMAAAMAAGLAACGRAASPPPPPGGLRRLCIHVPVRGGLGQRPGRFGRTHQNIDVLRR